VNDKYLLVDLPIERWPDNIASTPRDSKISDAIHPKDLFFRVDHQTFRKLPKSGGIIFGV